MFLANPSPMATKNLLASRPKPSLPELRIVISDDNKTSPGHIDSGYASALSQCPQDPDPLEGQVSPHSTASLSAGSPVSPQDALSVFTNPTPFGNHGPLPATPPIAHPLGSRKNIKKLSLTSLDPRPISPTPSTLSLRSVAPNNAPTSLPPSPHYPHRKLSLNPPPRLVSIPTATGSEVPVRRRSSVMSLPVTSSSKVGRRHIEDDAEGNPYENGPVEILPGVWLGAEENAQDWDSLTNNNIGGILNVAKEVILPFDRETPESTSSGDGEPLTMHFGKDYASGRPALSYLHLPWSHGQSDLVKQGFVDGMAFIDKYLAKNIGVLIHCQCGISRSATLAIAYVMRAAHMPHPLPQIASLKKGGMQSAYSYVKAKSQLVGPNMSLIYQLLEYERSLSPVPQASSESSGRSEEEEWTRQRLAMDEEDNRQSSEKAGLNQTALETAEARELDQRMIERRDHMQRYPSRSSITSSVLPDSSVHGKSRFGNPIARPRGLSIGSDRTSRSSVVSDSLLEVNEESEYDETEYDEGSGHSRKSSVEIETVDGDSIYLNLSALDRSTQSPVILPPILRPRRKQGDAGVPPPPTALKAGSFLDSSSYASVSRQTSTTSLSSGPPEKNSFLPSPSAPATPSSFVVPFPRRRSPSPNFSLPSSRNSRRVPNLHTVLDSVPSSPDLSEAEIFPLGLTKRRPPAELHLSIPQEDQSQRIEVCQDSDDVSLGPPDRKGRPPPLRIPVSPRQSNYAIVSSSDSGEESALSQPSSVSSVGSHRAIPDDRRNRLRWQALLYPPSTSTSVAGSATPHQTLFIFPASPTWSGDPMTPAGGLNPTAPTPSTMLLTTTMNPTSPMSSKGSTRAVSTSSLSSDASSITTHSSASRRRVMALPSGVTPTLAAFRSSINGSKLRKGDWAGMPSTPTTATAHVEARGWMMGAGSSGSTDMPLSPWAGPMHSRSRIPY